MSTADWLALLVNVVAAVVVIVYIERRNSR